MTFLVLSYYNYLNQLGELLSWISPEENIFRKEVGDILLSDFTGRCPKCFQHCHYYSVKWHRCVL